MTARREVIGGPVVMNGRSLSVSGVLRAGGFVLVAGRVPMRDCVPLTTGGIEGRTRTLPDRIRETLALAGCAPAGVVKATMWPTERANLSGCNAVYGEHFPAAPPAHCALVTGLLVDAGVEVEVGACNPR